MQSLLHVGIDLAWSSRNRTGIAAVDAHGALLASATVTSDDEVVAWIASHAPRTGVVAIDAPLVVTNALGNRPCERLVNAAFGRFDAGAHPSNLSKPWFDPPRASILAERLGLVIDPSTPNRERVAIEVYPHPAMVGLFRLGRTLKYKRKRQGFELQLSETRRLLDLMEGVDSLRLRASEDWAVIRRAVDVATGPAALGKVEDEIDGILCAHLAWLWAQFSPALTVYGDVEHGYIVAPPEPSWPPTPRLSAPSIRALDDVVMVATPRRRSSTNDVAVTWDRLERLLSALPEGRWTTYGDVATALDHHAQPVSGRIAKVRPGAYSRVIRTDGTVSQEFTWANGQKDRDQPVLAKLASEGVATVGGRADPTKRLSVAELRELLARNA